MFAKGSVKPLTHHATGSHRASPRPTRGCPVSVRGALCHPRLGSGLAGTPASQHCT